MQRVVYKSASQKALIDSILRVDHVGELAANQIYKGQMAVLKSWLIFI